LILNSDKYITYPDFEKLFDLYWDYDNLDLFSELENNNSKIQENGSSVIDTMRETEIGKVFDPYWDYHNLGLFSGFENNNSKIQEMIESYEIKDYYAKPTIVPTVADEIENELSKISKWIRIPQNKFSIESNGGILATVFLGIILTCIMIKDLSP